MNANRILVLEDERDVAHLMRSVLEDEGYQVLVHPTGDCIGVARAFQPDIVITDYMLPLYDGRAVIDRVHRELASDLPCILISAMRHACKDWRSWGAFDFLAKPFDLESVLQSVQRARQQAAQNYADIYGRDHQQKA